MLIAIPAISQISIGSIMALITCKECKKEVSNKAEKCPHCGFKMPTQYSLFKSIVLVFFIIPGVLYFIFNNNDVKPQSTYSGATSDSAAFYRADTSDTLEEAIPKTPDSQDANLNAEVPKIVPSVVHEITQAERDKQEIVGHEFSLCFDGAQNQLRAAILKSMNVSEYSAIEIMTNELREYQLKSTDLNFDFNRANEIMRTAIVAVYAKPDYTVELARETQEKIIKGCQIKAGYLKDLN
jgi:ribosomal protein S8E